MAIHQIRQPVASIYTSGELRVSCTCGWESPPVGSAAEATDTADRHLNSGEGPTVDVGEG